jgi:hypothetical protein
MARLYRPRGGVQIVRCPHCSHFFITYDYARVVRCRMCDSAFHIHVSPKARNFRPPRNRWIASFSSFQDAQKAFAILMKAWMEGQVLTNEEARMLISQGLEREKKA